MRSKHAVIVLLLAIFVAGVLVGAVSLAILDSQRKVRSVGFIRTVGVEVYADEELTVTLDYIDWGNVTPGSNNSYPAWIKNTGNDKQKFITWTESWDPENASDFLTPSWSYSGVWVPSNSSIPVNFTLAVSEDIEGITHFSYDIWVQGVH